MVQLALYSALLVASLTVAVAYGQHTKGFRVSEYVLLFILPLGYVLWLSTIEPDVLVIYVG